MHRIVESVYYETEGDDFSAKEGLLLGGNHVRSDN
jgi:hypothetical protein